MIYKHPTITTDDLPNECLYEIFKYLNLQDVINCRTVSKRFKSISDIIKFRQLIVCDIIGELKSMWFADKSRPINYMNAINFQTFRSSFNLKDSLERLHIRRYGHNYFKLSNLAGFNNLQELDIDCQIHNVHLTLELPKLRMLRLTKIYDEFDLHLKAPTKLEILDSEYLHQLEIDHPESIKQLRICRIDEEELPQLAAMKNLEYLQIREVSIKIIQLEDILSVFKNLKHLQFDNSHVSNVYMRDYLKNVLVDALQRPNFKLYLEGVELVDSRKVDEYYSSETIQDFLMQNINLLNGDLSNIDRIYFNSLFNSTVNNRILTNYVSKLCNIREVKANGKVNVEYLIWLLKKLDHLEELGLDQTELSQTFFDHTLPDICPNLVRLSIRSRSNLIKQINFLEKFGLLLYFYLSDEIVYCSVERNHPDHKFNIKLVIYGEARKPAIFDLNELFVRYSRLRADKMTPVSRKNL